MISITKDEKMAISEKFPNVHIVRTMRQDSKRHHYYCEETGQIMNYLNGVRENKDNKKAGADSGHREKTRRNPT